MRNEGDDREPTRTWRSKRGLWAEALPARPRRDIAAVDERIEHATMSDTQHKDQGSRPKAQGSRLKAPKHGLKAEMARRR